MLWLRPYGSWRTAPLRATLTKRTGALSLAFSLGLLLCLTSACGFLCPSIRDEAHLLESIRGFHRALAEQDTVHAVSFLPPDERSRSQTLLDCFFGRIRIVDFRLGEIQSTGNPEIAKISVQGTSQPWNDLSTRDFLWEEKWMFLDQRWKVRLDFEPFLRLERDCPVVSP